MKDYRVLDAQIDEQDFSRINQTNDVTQTLVKTQLQAVVQRRQILLVGPRGGLADDDVSHQPTQTVARAVRPLRRR